LIVPFKTLPPLINEDGNPTNMDVMLLSEDYDDPMFDVSFERIFTPIPKARSSTKAYTDSPGFKLKKIRVEEEAKINEEVDAYLYHLPKVDVQHIKCTRVEVNKIKACSFKKMPFEMVERKSF